MKVNNPWVGYLTRSYEQIKAQLLLGLITKTPEITDHSESNPLVVIIDMFAGIAEQWNYYIDQIARESFIGTARQLRSVLKLSYMLGYTPKANTPATVDIIITLLDPSGNEIGSSTPWTIPSGTYFYAASGERFYTDTPITFPIGQSYCVIPTKNLNLVGAPLNIGITDGSNNQDIILNIPTYAHKTSYIIIAGITYNEVSTLAFSKPTDKHYVILMSESSNLYVRFGDNVNGAIPTPASSIMFYYRTTNGARGNTLIAGSINTSSLPILPLLSGVTSVTVGNINNPAGGSSLESIETIRYNAILNLRTLDRAVTYQDYYDMLQLVPGVLKGEIDFCCSDTDGVSLYVLPIGGGLASSGLLADVGLYFDTRKTLGTKITPKPVGQSIIVVNVVSVIFNGVNDTQSLIEQRTALVNYFSANNQEINGAVRKSEITALLTTLNTVSYIKSLTMYVIPYMKPVLHSNPLNHTLTIKTTALIEITYRLVYLGSSTFTLSNNLSPVATNVVIGTPFNDTNITLNITSGTYVLNTIWEFKVIPYNQDIELSDFSIPTLDLNLVNIVIEKEGLTLKRKKC